MKKDTVVYAAFCGTGKSYLSTRFPKECMEVECWKYREGNFPHNYADVIEKLVGEVRYLFISTDPVVLQELYKRNIRIKLYYPENKLREEYLNRFIERESPFDFIGVLMVCWHTWINQLKEQEYCEHVVLKEGEYLKDVL